MNTQALQQVLGLIKSGQYPRAKAELLRHMKVAQRDPQVLNALAVVNAYMTDFASAEYYALAATKAAPQSGAVWSTLANVHAQMGKATEAAAAYERALELDPRDSASWLGRSTLEQHAGEFARSEAILRKGLEACGPTETLMSALAGVVADSGRADEGFVLLERAIEAAPRSLELRSLACNISMSSCHLGPAEIGAVHRAYGEVLQREYPAPLVRYQQPRQPKTKLRVGLVSSDLRRHSVAYFIEPFLRHADRERCEVLVYCNQVKSDDVTRRLRGMVEAWRDVAGMSDPELSQQIYGDQIDVLVDLNGHTAANRLGVFHNKPAPVQLTYLGYPGSTGLRSIDGRIVDEVTDPPGMTESQHTETLLRLGRCFLCYVPPEVAPAPAAPEAAHCTFGTFNALHKISDVSLELWARVLETVPRSRLLIKSPKGGREEAGIRVVERASRCGIDTSRIAVQPAIPDFQEHLRMYSQVDVVLDAFPYNGTTTTCEALYMGVPVVSLAGRSHVSRVGASLLRATGCDMWVAHDREAYVSIATELGTDLASTRGLRQTLRSRMQAQRICDQQEYSRAMVDAIHRAWQWWCEGEER